MPVITRMGCLLESNQSLGSSLGTTPQSCLLTPSITHALLSHKIFSAYFTVTPFYHKISITLLIYLSRRLHTSILLTRRNSLSNTLFAILFYLIHFMCSYQLIVFSFMTSCAILQTSTNSLIV